MRAQEFFRVAPGKLSDSHAAWDKSDGCVSCHELGGGVTDAKCLDCHKTLQQEIVKGKGLHPGFKARCINCHTEHKGRQYNIINWSRIGGRENFDHSRTGFKLEKKHTVIACANCHTTRMKSGRTSYVGLSRDCRSCHQNVHRTTLRACKECHESPRGHGERRAGADCKGCHGVDRPWKSAEYDHDKTGFPWRGGHRSLKCVKCHKQGNLSPGKQCDQCHRNPHKKRFAGYSCESCHKIPGSKVIEFDHGKVAKIELYGQHKEVVCDKCHTAGRPARVAKIPVQSADRCIVCHSNRVTHGKQFPDKSCNNCHVEGGPGSKRFDHAADTRFPLRGYHAKLAEQGKCSKCHPLGVYRTNKLACANCHNDAHRGQLGTNCAQCHSPQVAFKETVYDHSRSKRFPLAGLHQKVECKSCHVNRRYKFDSVACYECHAQKDPHQGKLGKECEKCHVPEKGAPRFNHQRMTEFPRTGAHSRAACSFCHRAVEPGAPRPRPGWTRGLQPQPVDKLFPVPGRQCVDCHYDEHKGAYGDRCDSCHRTVSFKEVARAVHDTGAFRLEGTHKKLPCVRCHGKDLKLGGLGAQCQLCHRQDDAHNNGLGPECGRCHSQIDWLPPRFNHTAAGYRLRGAHKTAACRDCHGVGAFQSIPTDCALCHKRDAARATDPLHSEAAFQHCEHCHNQVSFTPARFSHTSFPLQGAHRTLRCKDCHSAGRYANTPSQCASCHLKDFTRPGNSPNHQAAGFSTDCANCHKPTGWRPARFSHASLQLRGAHRALACRDCHPNNNYQGAFGGLSWDCAKCHGPGGPVSKWPPDHAAKGYPLSCELCHSENAWTPARKPP